MHKKQVLLTTLSAKCHIMVRFQFYGNKLSAVKPTIAKGVENCTKSKAAKEIDRSQQIISWMNYRELTEHQNLSFQNKIIGRVIGFIPA